MADERVRARRLAVVLGPLLLGLLAVPPASAQDDEPTGPPVDLGVYGTPIRFTAPEGTTIELGSGRRLVDTVEVRPNPSGRGSIVIAEMPMRDYVMGIAEMPARWPLEALKAQAVAARTYAWYSMQLGTFEGRGYDICATTACQVFRGQEVPETAEVGQHWARAVDETEGEVLLHEGEPILARYFSTSGGHTRNNEDIFPSSGAFPYLQGVEDPDDAVSPLHRWTSVFTREQFDDLLSRGQTLGSVTPIAEATVEPQEPPAPDQVVVTGPDDQQATVTTGELRDFLNDLAPDVYPDAFPGPRDDGTGPLPSTVPSSRYTIEVTQDQVVLHGSGWGHGVGMGQYGAMGKAERGLDHAEILAAYYSGLQPTTTPDLPARIRVGLADDLDELEIRADGPMRVTVGDTVVTERALGSWHTRTAADRTTRLVAPAGYGAPLVVDPTAASRTRPFAVETVALDTVVNKPAELRLVVRQDGEAVATQELGVVDPGRHHVDWSLDADGADLGPGTYEVVLEATDEDGVTEGGAVEVEVGAVKAAGGVPAPAPSPAGAEDRPGLPLAVVALLAGVGAVLGVGFGLRRSRKRVAP